MVPVRGLKIQHRNRITNFCRSHEGVGGRRGYAPALFHHRYGDYQMKNRNEFAPTTVSDDITAYIAIELSSISWVVAVKRPGSGKESLHKLAAGDVSGLMVLIDRARSCGASRVVCCYEAGRDGFWLHRYLVSRGVSCRVATALKCLSLLKNRSTRFRCL